MIEELALSLSYSLPSCTYTRLEPFKAASTAATARDAPAALTLAALGDPASSRVEFSPLVMHIQDATQGQKRAWGSSLVFLVDKEDR